MKQLIECVPNFSEGVDLSVIKQITGAIESVNGVRVLNVDPGTAANRTVVTFVGEPDAVVNAAFLAMAKAGELIDMRKQRGEHPRMGATDVCPLVPISNISLDETADYAKKLAKRVGDELNLPVYLYEHAQPNKKRSNLAVIRAGEYEGFFTKIKQPDWHPDFGPAEMDAKRGATVIGARDFLIAYNVNLNTTSTQIANAIAGDVRESGRTVNGVRQSGLLKAVKAIGWFIEEYSAAQVSMNLVDLNVTPFHIAFEAVCQRALARGVRVTGSELIGLVPLKTLTQAGSYFLHQQGRSTDVSEAELVQVAIATLGLDELAPFEPKERVIEYLLKKDFGTHSV